MYQFEYIDIIEKIKEIIKIELDEMVVSIVNKHQKNQNNRDNNPFNCFEEQYIKNFMGIARSFDSQLGNRLQNIAFKIVQLDISKTLPNEIIFSFVEDYLYIYLLCNSSLKQEILFIEKDYKIFENLNLLCYFKTNKKQIDFYKSLQNYYKVKDNCLKIPVDLMYFDNFKNVFKVFEIKSGGNLDTKNSDANYNEVIRLKKIFDFIPGLNTETYFATCYNNSGDGGKPKGAIYSKLSQNQILIGKEFWREILPKEVSYEKFEEIYKYIFKEIVQVENRLRRI